MIYMCVSTRPVALNASEYVVWVRAAQSGEAAEQTALCPLSLPALVTAGLTTIIISFLLSFRVFVEASGSYRLTHLFAAARTYNVWMYGVIRIKGLQLFSAVEGGGEWGERQKKNKKIKTILNTFFLFFFFNFVVVSVVFCLVISMGYSPKTSTAPNADKI